MEHSAICKSGMFEERTKLPCRGTQSELEKEGARYLTTGPFKREGAEIVIDYMALERSDGMLYFWKRIRPLEEKFTIHGEFSGIRYGMSDELKGTFNEYFSSVREKYFGKEAKRRILLGTFMRMAGYRDAYYIKALKLRTLITDEFKKILKNYDLILTPTMPILPPKFSEIEKLSALENYMSDALTVGPNLCGLPMISVPVKKNKSIGLHFISDHLQENKIISAGDFYERIR